jgi:hypothetical protein
MPKQMNATKPIEECKTVAELLEDPKRWTQCGGSAADATGNPVPSRDPQAAAFCVWGAISRVYRTTSVNEPNIRSAIIALKRAAELPVAPSFPHSLTEVFDWNDSPSLTHEAMLAAVKKAGI